MSARGPRIEVPTLRSTRYGRGAFPAYAFLPGHDPHPLSDPDGHSHGRPAAPVVWLPPSQWRRCLPYLDGCDLFNHGYWWEAHEAWESLWQKSRLRAPQQALFLQGLIQAANTLLKHRMGRPRAVQRLTRDVRRLLEAVCAGDRPYMGLSVHDWLGDFENYVAALPAGRLAAEGFPYLRLG